MDDQYVSLGSRMDWRDSHVEKRARIGVVSAGFGWSLGSEKRFPLGRAHVSYRYLLVWEFPGSGDEID